ncbi:hypothetical protein SCUCBS95973_005712 [Sporothrix curviconia]|uniref:2EXR domain-containing protein n=1 Tax=Sporothrix curviconia TaxID=1260050 RepID=A0ABP0C179_9PEZI
MDSFQYFQDLPAELRVSIWRMSRLPRVVEVWYDADADCCRTTSRPPALLHVNREARAEALHQGWYRRAFRTRSRPRDHYIYFSPALDVLYLPRHGLMGYDDAARDFALHVRDTAEHVRALAIDHVRTDTIRPWEPYNKLMLLFSFPHVQEAILVVGSSSLPASSSSSSSSSPGSTPPSPPSPLLSASYDRRVFQQRSQESIESAESINAASVSSSSSSSSSSSPKRAAMAMLAGKGDVELVDPQGDVSAIMGVIDNVIESFSRVIEDTAAAHNDSIALLMDKEDGYIPIPAYPNIPSLIPKAIAYHRQQRQCQLQRHRKATITRPRVVEA